MAPEVLAAVIGGLAPKVRPGGGGMAAIKADKALGADSPLVIAFASPEPGGGARAQCRGCGLAAGGKRPHNAPTGPSVRDGGLTPFRWALLTSNTWVQIPPIPAMTIRAGRAAGDGEGRLGPCAVTTPGLRA